MEESKSLVGPTGRVIKCTFFVTVHLDKEQVRVSEVSPDEYRVKCGRMLTDLEVKGAIVKYILAKREREQQGEDRLDNRQGGQRALEGGTRPNLLPKKD
jgi:hypothetical protein